MSISFNPVLYTDYFKEMNSKKGGRMKEELKKKVFYYRTFYISKITSLKCSIKKEQLDGSLDQAVIT